MCELFAMSAKTPTSLTYSLEEFSRNGSRTRSNRDGWGIAMVRDRDAFLIKEPSPANDSMWVRFVAENAIETAAAIAHVRYATRGEHTMENTHPFRRALGGRVHLFAHNGTLKDIESATDINRLPYRPVGNTDSELAFCLLLARLNLLYDAHESPDLDSRFEVFRNFCADMKRFGSCNFLYHDGDVLFAHGHKRVYEENGELTDAKPPGLNIKKCWTCAGKNEEHCPGLDVDFADDQTILLASVPLDDEGWEPLAEGAVLAMKNGVLLREQ